MSENNGQVMLLAGQLQQAVGTLRNMMEGVSSEVVHAVPNGKGITIAANSAHVVTVIDGIVHGMIKEDAPVMMSMPTGLSAPPPQGSDWGDWGQTVQIEHDAFHAYAEKVMESATAYIGSLSDADLKRSVKAPSGTEMSVAGWLTIAVLNTAWHTGEVAALKGMNGLQGYPF